MLEHELADILFKQSPMRMAVVSVPAFRYEIANAAEADFCKSLGATDFIGRTWAEVCEDKVPSKFTTILDEVASAGKPLSVIDEAVEAVVGGVHQVTYVSFDYFPIRGKTGAVEHILWVQKADRQEAEQRAADWEAAVKAMRVERQRLYDVLETLPVMVCLITPDYHIAFANRTFREKFGESGGRHCYEYCVGFAQPCPFCESLVPLKTGRPHHWEFVHPNGNTFIDAYDFPFSDADGSPLILEMNIDITERKKIEEALRESEAKYRELVKYAPAGIFEIDFRARRLVSVNDVMSELCGYSREELLQMDPMDLLDDAGKQAFDVRVRQWLSGETPANDVDYVVRTKGGREIYARLSAKFTRDSNGNPKGATVIGHDVTERRKMEADLLNAQHAARMEAEQRAAEYDALFNSVSEAIFMTDESGQVVFANPAGMRLAGLKDSPLNVDGMNFQPQFRMLHPDGTEMKWEERPVVRVRNGETFDNLACRYVNLEGREVESLSSGGWISTPLGRRAFLISRDITEMRRLERMKDEFMLVVGHELRNPLQVILGRLQLLETKFDEDSHRQFGKDVDSLKAQTRLLMSIVEDLLNAYRVGTGRLSVDVARTDFKETVVSALEHYLTEPYHRWSFSLPRTAVDIMADPLRLGQAITNLLTNAQKYTPTGKAIHVTLSKRNGSALLRVEDEGVGIPPEDLEKVFAGFYRTPDVTKWQPGSVGLGLFISRGLVKRMGGDLWAENRPGGGTVMCVKMPLVK